MAPQAASSVQETRRCPPQPPVCFPLLLTPAAVPLVCWSLRLFLGNLALHSRRLPGCSQLPPQPLHGALQGHPCWTKEGPPAQEEGTATRDWTVLGGQAGSCARKEPTQRAHRPAGPLAPHP